MDVLLILFVTLVICFLIAEAFLYIARPWFMIDEEDNDIRMWDGFIFSLTLALVAVITCALIIRHSCYC